MSSNNMSERSAVTEQRGGLPLSREVGSEGRKGRRQFDPSDPEATSSNDDYAVVEGGRIRDAVVGEIDGELRRYRDLHTPHSPPVTQRQQSTVGKAAAAVQVRSKPVQPGLTGDSGRAISGASVLQLCRPGREGDKSTRPLRCRVVLHGAKVIDLRVGEENPAIAAARCSLFNKLFYFINSSLLI